MRHSEGHYGHRVGWLRAMVLGANDGIISTAALLLGVAAANKLEEAILREGPDTVAAINGFCFGGAFDLALSCKRRVAVATAEFCHPGVGLGIITGWGGTQRLPRLVGEAAALEMFMTARRVSAEEALRIGLIDEINDDPVAVAVGPVWT